MSRSKPSAKIEEGRMDDAPIYRILKPSLRESFEEKYTESLEDIPCQPFSSAGKRKGEKDPRHLWPYIREHVRAVRPLWCFFENVRGHTTMGLWRVLSDLEEDGYRTEWGLFSAEETGAPHQRIRCFILAYRECAGSQGWIYGGQNKEREGVDGYSRCGGAGAHGRRDSEQLAHTASREPRQSQARNGGQDTSGGREEELVYIARTEGSAKPKPAKIPGEEQYEWKNHGSPKLNPNWVEQLMGLPIGWTDLGSWGNGVVPQTAELAWKTLWQRI